MLLKITHQTDLAYTDLISESVMELRMAPRQDYDQHRLSFDLAIGPPTSVTSYFDWLGNTVHAFTINAFHRQIRIVATSVVETSRPRIEPPEIADTWPLDDSLDYSLYDYLHFGGPIVDSPLLRQLVDDLGPRHGESLGELAMRLLQMIDERFTYQTGVTNFASPITDTLEHGRGVCQDFTHLMIGMARAMNIPARYISGFIHPHGDRRRGHTQTHAWCELLFPSYGWVGFDVTNNCVIESHFVKVAIGRDFRDVPPNKGVYRGNAKEKIEVTVQSDELSTIPSELAAERFQSLSLPVYAAGSASHRELVNQQQEQQQQ